MVEAQGKAQGEKSGAGGQVRAVVAASERRKTAHQGPHLPLHLLCGYNTDSRDELCHLEA